MSASAPAENKSNKFGSFDLVRVFAMVLVTIQHVCSVNDSYDKTVFFRTSIGQYGVGIFCAISGFLAFQDQRAPRDWLKRRLIRLFPAYWIATVLAFALTSFSSYKKFDVYQFISQMLGLGFFTHGWNLVNVVSWFISLILLCYVLGFLAKLSGKPLIVLSVVTVICSGILIARVAFKLHEHGAFDLSQHVISFTVGAIAGSLAAPKRLRLLFGSAILLALLAIWSRGFAYSGASLFLLGLSLIFSVEQAFISLLAGYTYEYFLMHGIALVGAAKVFPKTSPQAIVAGLVGAVVGAWLLKWVTNLLTKKVPALRG